MSQFEAPNSIDVWSNIDGEHRWRLEMRIALFDPNFSPNFSYRADEIQTLLSSDVLREYGEAILSRLGTHHWVTTYLNAEFPNRAEFTTQDVKPEYVEKLFRELIDQICPAMLFTLWDYSVINYKD